MRTFPFFPANFLQRVWRELGRWVAYLWFCVCYRFLNVPAARGGKQVLFMSLAEWGPRLKMEGMVARSLMEQGCVPVVLTYRRFRWAQRYFRTFGVRDFLYFDDFQNAVDQTVTNAEANRLLQNTLTFDTLFRYVQQDIEIGRHVLSTVVRGLEKGNVSFDDPAVLRLLEQILPTALRDAAAARLLFDRIQPEAVLFIEKGYTPFGLLFDESLRRKLNTVQYPHGHKSDAIVLKRYTKENRYSHHFSLSQKSWERTRAMDWVRDDQERFMDELRQSYASGTWFNRKYLLEGKKMKSPEEVRRQLHLDPTKKTAVIFSHVLWDATFFFGENLFVDYEQWLVETVRVACSNTAVNWVIKLHPDYTWKRKISGEPSDSPRDIIAIAAGVGTLPPHVQVVTPDTDISTHSFFAVTNYCITVRGTVGIEASCFGIPVFTAGTGRYSGLGFTIDSTSKEEFLSHMRSIQNVAPMTPMQTDLARRHAYGLFSLRALSVRTFEMVPTHRFGIYDQDLLIRVRSLAELRQADDLRTLATWILESRDEDYLALPSAA